MTLVEDLERIARRMTPEALAALREHLEQIDCSARSEILIHHRPDGVGVRVEGHKRLKTVDMRTPQGVPSAR